VQVGHVEEEEDEMFKKARKILSEEDLKRPVRAWKGEAGTASREVGLVERRVNTTNREVSYGRSITRASSRSRSLEIRRRMYFNNSNFHHRVLVAGICALLTEPMDRNALAMSDMLF
jgi:hypothetical protein